MLAVVFLVVSLAGSVFLRISHARDVKAFFGMAAECHPIWKQLAFRRFGPGDPARELFLRFPPSRREEFGRYGIYSFNAGPADSLPMACLSIVTKDGKLISAVSGGCTWDFTFFRTADAEISHQYATFTQERHHRLEQKWLEKLKAKLQRFYLSYDRWPTNEFEFSWFVTGQKPPTPESIDQENRWRRRFGGPRRSQNPLGIAFTFREDGALTIALPADPDLVGTVARPTKEEGLMP